jgi:uncharacterized protein (DUF58 family)
MDRDDGVIYLSQASLIGLQADAALLNVRPGQVRSRLSGQYLSHFKGRGMEFDEARPYQPGDDIRNMDWRVTARTNKPHSKLFREERERPVLLWVDYRASMFFGTRVCYKSVLATRLAAIIGWSANRDGDRIGALLFDEMHHLELRPGRGKKSVLRFMRHLAEFSQKPTDSITNSDDSNPQQPLNRLVEVTRPGSRVVLISDFRRPGDRFEQTLARLSAHNELQLLHIYDPLEAELPLAGRYRVSDGASEAVLDAGSADRRGAYAEQFHARQLALQALARKYRIDYRAVQSGDDALSVMGAGRARRNT